MILVSWQKLGHSNALTWERFTASLIKSESPQGLHYSGRIFLERSRQDRKEVGSTFSSPRALLSISTGGSRERARALIGGTWWKREGEEKIKAWTTRKAISSSANLPGHWLLRPLHNVGAWRRSEWEPLNIVVYRLFHSWNADRYVVCAFPVSVSVLCIYIHIYIHTHTHTRAHNAANDSYGARARITHLNLMQMSFI